MPITLMPHAAAQREHTRVPPLVVAHRGASAEWPENTIPAFSAGIDQGADMIEIDVHLSRDGVPIVIHDDSLVRTTNAAEVLASGRDLAVASLSADEIDLLDAGSWKGERFAGIGVPQLAEVLELVHASRTGLLLEIKHPHRYPGISEALIASFAEVPGYFDRALAAGLVVVQSADWEFMRGFHALAPEIPVGLLGSPHVDRLGDFAGWVDQINPQHARGRSVRPEFLRRVHELGMSSLVWTIDDACEMDAAIDAGVDGIITNDPALLIEVIDAL